MDAIISLRLTGTFALMLLVAAITDPDDNIGRQVLNVLDKASLALCALVTLRLALGPQLFIQAEFSRIQDINDGGRPLSASGALLIASAAAVQLSRLMRNRITIWSWDGAKLGALVISLLLTGQGTATICGAVGLGLVWGFENGAIRSARITLFTGLAITFLTIAIIAPSALEPSNWLNLLPDAISENLNRRQSNLGTRQIIWEGIITQWSEASTLNQIIGWPAGERPQIIINSRAWGTVIWEANAHSMYFGTLISHGIIGVTILVMIAILAGTASLRRSIAGSTQTGDLSPPGTLALISIFITYSYSYNIDNEASLILATALLAAQRRPRIGDRQLSLRQHYSRE